MRVGDEQLVDPVVFLGLRGLFAAAAAFLRAVLGQWLALDVAAVTERDDHVGRRDQVFGAEFQRVAFDDAAARAELGLAKLLAQRAEFAADDGRHALRLGQDVQQIGDLGHHLTVLADDLVLLQPGQALQAHLQDLLRLIVGQAIQAVGLHAVARGQAFGAVRGTAAGRHLLGAREHLSHHR